MTPARRNGRRPMLASPRRYQHAATGGAVLLTAACVNALVHDEEIPAILFGLGVLILTEAALREHRHLRRQRLEHDWARRRALGHNPAPLTPCCLLARASHDQAHDQNCTGTHSLEQFLTQIESEHGNDS